MNILHIGASGATALTDGHEYSVSTVVLQVSGIAADSGSMTPQLRIAMTGSLATPPAWVNCAYINLASGAVVAAGTAITADGIYEVSTNGCFLGMNVTAVTAGYTLYLTPLEGPTLGAGGSSVSVSNFPANQAVSGHSVVVQPTVTVTASAYTANYCVGGLITVAAGRAANLYVTLEDLKLVDHANNSSATYDLVVFKSTPAATFTDHAAFPTLSAADLALIVGRVSLATTDGVAVGGARIYAPIFQPTVMPTDGSGDVYVAINASVAPTFANTTDLKLKLGFFQD